MTWAVSTIYWNTSHHTDYLLPRNLIKSYAHLKLLLFNNGTHLSEHAPDDNEPINTPPMNAVDANWIRKLQPQTKLYWNHTTQ